MAPPVNLTNFVVSRCCSHASMQCKSRSKLLLQIYNSNHTCSYLDQYQRPPHEVDITAAVCKQNTVGLHTILHIIILQCHSINQALFYTYADLKFASAKVKSYLATYTP